MLKSSYTMSVKIKLTIQRSDWFDLTYSSHAFISTCLQTNFLKNLFQNFGICMRFTRMYLPRFSLPFHIFDNRNIFALFQFSSIPIFHNFSSIMEKISYGKKWKIHILDNGISFTKALTGRSTCCCRQTPNLKQLFLLSITVILLICRI